VPTVRNGLARCDTARSSAIVTWPFNSSLTPSSVAEQRRLLGQLARRIRQRRWVDFPELVDDQRDDVLAFGGHNSLRWWSIPAPTARARFSRRSTATRAFSNSPALSCHPDSGYLILTRTDDVSLLEFVSSDDVVTAPELSIQPLLFASAENVTVALPPKLKDPSEQRMLRPVELYAHVPAVVDADPAT
jgi:hypothetical protein